MFVRRLREVRHQLGGLAASFDPALVGGADAAAVVAACSEIERLASGMRTLAAPRVEATWVWRGTGQRSAAHWLAQQAGTSVGEAISSLRTGKQLDGLAGTRKAVQQGKLSPKQAELVAQGAAADHGAEAKLLQLASQASLGELRKESQRTIAAAQPDEAAAHRRVWKARSFRHRVEADGTWVGTLRTTVEAGALVMAAIGDIRPRVFNRARRSGEWSSAEAYDADAAVELAREHFARTGGVTAPGPGHDTEPSPSSDEEAAGGGGGGGGGGGAVGGGGGDWAGADDRSAGAGTDLAGDGAVAVSAEGAGAEGAVGGVAGGSGRAVVGGRADAMGGDHGDRALDAGDDADDRVGVGGGISGSDHRAGAPGASAADAAATSPTGTHARVGNSTGQPAAKPASAAAHPAAAVAAASNKSSNGAVAGTAAAPARSPDTSPAPAARSQQPVPSAASSCGSPARSSSAAAPPCAAEPGPTTGRQPAAPASVAPSNPVSTQPAAGVAAVLAQFPGATVTPALPPRASAASAPRGAPEPPRPPADADQPADPPLSDADPPPAATDPPADPDPPPEPLGPADLAPPPGRYSGSQAACIVRVDHSALVRGHSEPGELCEITGIGPAPVEVVRRLLAGAFLAAVVTTDAGEVAAVVHLGRRSRHAKAAARQYLPPEQQPPPGDAAAPHGTHPPGPSGGPPSGPHSGAPPSCPCPAHIGEPHGDAAAAAGAPPPSQNGEPPAQPHTGAPPSCPCPAHIDEPHSVGGGQQAGTSQLFSTGSHLGAGGAPSGGASGGESRPGLDAVAGLGPITKVIVRLSNGALAGLAGIPGVNTEPTTTAPGEAGAGPASTSGPKDTGGPATTAPGNTGGADAGPARPGGAACTSDATRIGDGGDARDTATIPLADDAFVAALRDRGQTVASLVHHKRAFTALQRTVLEFRDPECVVLGCTSTARLERDHRTDWAFTHTTDASDANNRCHFHHMLKTRYGWRLEPGTGKRRLLPPRRGRQGPRAGKRARP